jgi:general secretion pathway protein G
MSFENTATCPTSTRQARRRPLNNRGITLVELIVVVAIIAVLALMAIPTYNRIEDVVRGVRAMEEIRGFEKVIYSVSIDKGGALPTGLDVLGMTIPNDPWNRPYEYYVIPHPSPTPSPARAFLGDPLNDDFDLYSKGKDGSSAPDTTDDLSADDILRAGNGGFVGRATDARL